MEIIILLAVGLTALLIAVELGLEKHFGKFILLLIAGLLLAMIIWRSNASPEVLLSPLQFLT